MRALILIAGAALAVAASASAPNRGEQDPDHARYQGAYADAAIADERERKEFAREAIKTDREQRRNERAYERGYDQDNDADEDDCGEDGPDDG